MSTAKNEISDAATNTNLMAEKAETAMFNLNVALLKLKLQIEEFVLTDDDLHMLKVVKNRTMYLDRNLANLHDELMNATNSTDEILEIFNRLSL